MKVDRPPIRSSTCIDFQITRQLKQQRPFSSAANSDIDLRRCLQHRRRLHRRSNPERRDGDIVIRGCRRRASPDAAWAQMKSRYRRTECHLLRAAAPPTTARRWPHPRTLQRRPVSYPADARATAAGISGRDPFRRGREKMAEVEQQAQGVKLRQIRGSSRSTSLRSPLASAAGDRKGCKTAAVSSLKRRYPEVNCSSRIAIPVNSASDPRSTRFGGRSRISPSPSKNAPVIRPQMSSVKASVPSSKSRWRFGRSMPGLANVVNALRIESHRAQCASRGPSSFAGSCDSSLLSAAGQWLANETAPAKATSTSSRHLMPRTAPVHLGHLTTALRAVARISRVRALVLILVLFAALPASADVIHLKNGRTIWADQVRENKDHVEYDLGEDTYAIPKSSVDRIDAGGVAPGPRRFASSIRRSRPTSLRPRPSSTTKPMSPKKSSATAKSMPTHSPASRKQAIPNSLPPLTFSPASTNPIMAIFRRPSAITNPRSASSPTTPLC